MAASLGAHFFSIRSWRPPQGWRDGVGKVEVDADADLTGVDTNRETVLGSKVASFSPIPGENCGDTGHGLSSRLGKTGDALLEL